MHMHEVTHFNLYFFSYKEKPKAKIDVAVMDNLHDKDVKNEGEYT